MDAFDWRKDFIERCEAELGAASGDGFAKWSAGLKPIWYQDKSHEAAIFSHLARWKKGEKADNDSGLHPLVHLAWRALAKAFQETGNFPPNPEPLHTLD